MGNHVNASSKGKAEFTKASRGRKSLAPRLVGALFAFLVLFGAFVVVGGADLLAKPIGQKNKQACDNCKAVLAGTAPEGYTGVPGTEVGDTGKYSVYSGGNSYSNANSVELDQDPTDFAKPLPYGNVYIDASKLNWDNPDGFIIDIKDTDHFKWVAIGETLTDATGKTKSTSDPMALTTAKPLQATGQLRGIFYVGPLTSYLSDVTSAVSTSGYTNDITPGSKPYLYRITYLNAATLPDGTKGHLVLTMNRVQIETSVTVDGTHPYTLTAQDKTTYSYDKALIKIQGENQLGNDTGYSFKDSEGNSVNQQESVVMTATQAGSRLTTLNGALPSDEGIEDEWAQEKVIRNATGNILDLDIEVIDAEGNPVDGTISYAAHDMDFESAQNVWGRPVGSEFAEAMMVVDGALSYALVPNYNHASATTRDTGWLPVGPEEDGLSRALNITRESSGSNANGIRFASPFLVNYRDANGKYVDIPFSNTAVTSFQGDGLTASNRTITIDGGPNAITNLAKKQAYAMMPEASRPGSWRNVTPEMAWEVLGPYGWKTYRNDSDASFDSGFATLLSSKKSSLRWTGSRGMGANLNTTLFDTTLYTYIQQTHGTGGGIYMENYNLASECATTRMEGVATMSKGESPTVTVVPEDGYRVKTIRVGGEGLSKPTVYTIAELDFVDGIYEDAENGVTIEQNADGSYDVTLSNVQTPRHIHADFTNDYYFYKVWKKVKGSKSEIPETLELTATPNVFEMTEVTIEGETYTISDEGTTYTDSKGKVHTMSPNYKLTIGEGENIKIYTLEGDKLVDSDGNEYPITTEMTTGDPVTFKVSGSGSDVDDGYVKVETDKSGNTIWKIKYPAEGRTATSGEWPELPIETYDGSEHNYNHVQRNYWFVTETQPDKWPKVEYDNSTALAPGVVTAPDGGETHWKSQATIYHDATEELIDSEDDNERAFMSPLSTEVTGSDGKTKYTGWGGEIKNSPEEPPVGENDETWGAPGETQTGKCTFTEGTGDIPEKGAYTMLDPKTGKPTNTITIKGEGKYTIDPDTGEVTFVPEKGFVGKGKGVTVQLTDSLGYTATAKYNPNVKGFTVTYLDGDHGKSDGKGNQKNVPVGKNVKGGNTVTPDKGYAFTGKYTYTITQPDGTVITGETDDPKSVYVTGDVVFTPIYKKLPHVIYIDPATGRTIQKQLDFLAEGVEPPAPADPTRPGYVFDGWDREVDAEGNVIYRARWKPAPNAKKVIPHTGDVSQVMAGAMALALSGGIGSIAMGLKKRRDS